LEESASLALLIQFTTGTLILVSVFLDITGWERKSDSSHTNIMTLEVHTPQTLQDHIHTNLPTLVFHIKSQSSLKDPTTTTHKSTPEVPTLAMLSVLPPSTLDRND